MAFDGTFKHSDNCQKRATKWKQRGDMRFTEQQQHLLLWQVIAELFYPERADMTTQWSGGDERYRGIFTGEPQRLRRDLSSTLGAMLRPRGRRWFRMVVRPKGLMQTDEIKRWCEDATDKQWSIVYDPRANFTRAMAESDGDFVTFGNAVLAHTYNMHQDGLFFRCCHLRDCAWAENALGVVNEMHEKMKLELRQIAQLFGGAEFLPKDWQRELKDKPTEKKMIRRCVAPIEEYDYDDTERALRAKGMEYASIYMAEGVSNDECFLGERYFRVFPYLVRRWMTVSGENYGRSMCTGIALADGRTLNTAQADLLQSIEWAVNPPRTAPDEAMVGEVRLQAGEVIYTKSEYDSRTGKPFDMIETGDPRYGMELTDRIREDMSNDFFRNILQYLPDKEMTAFEVGQHLERFTAEAAPIFEPMEADNAQLMEGVFYRAADKEAYGPIETWPQDLMRNDASVEFEFETPLSDAIKKQTLNQADQLTARIVPMAEVNPSVLDNYDFDQIARDVGEASGPLKWVKKEEERDAAREKAAEQAAAQEQAAMALEAGKAIGSANPENLRMIDEALGEAG